MTACDPRRLRQQVALAEQATTGSIQVSLAPMFWGDVRAFAERAFITFGMSATVERNAVLILVAPRRKQLVILGDVGIYGKVSHHRWQTVVTSASQRCRTGDMHGAVEQCVVDVGAILAQHYPVAR